MAIKIQSYWKTTDMTKEQLEQSIKSCKTQDFKLLELYKTYGTLTADDAYVLYNTLCDDIKESSLRRSNDKLLKNGAIYPTGSVDGPYGRPVTLYTVIDNPPTELKTFNSEIPRSISINLIFDEEGKLDVDKMYEATSEKLDFIINKYNV